MPDTGLPPDPEVIRLPPELMDRAVGVMATVAPWALPLLSACREGIIAIAAISRGQAAPRRVLEGTYKPTCVWLQDDDETATGPGGFPSAKWLCTRWAKMAIVHGAGGEREHYIGAVLATVVHRRVLFVETDSGHVGEWCALLGNGTRMPVLQIIPPDGRQHPAPRAAGSLQ